MKGLRLLRGMQLPLDICPPENNEREANVKQNIKTFIDNIMAFYESDVVPKFPG